MIKWLKMVEGLQIKKTKKEKDLNDILNLTIQIIDDKERTNIESSLHRKNSHVWIARLNGELIGYAVANQKYKKGKTLECDWIYVEPKYRKEGVGSEIKKQQILFAKKHNFKDIHSYVETLQALKIWEKQKSLGLKIKKCRLSDGYDHDVWIEF